MIKIKKIFTIIFIIIISINFVYAKEYPEITDDIEIRYKWYKEITGDGNYYPLKSITNDDLVDKNNIKYVGDKNLYNEENCSLSAEYYLIDKKITKTYKKIYDASYLLINNIEDENDINIYYDNQQISFNVISEENGVLKINLNKPYQCDRLSFYINVNEDIEYTISLYQDLGFRKQIITKNLKGDKLAIPDESWVTRNTTYYIENNPPSDIREGAFTVSWEKKTVCSAREKYIYKYERNKEYYDDKYHLNVDGYIKDINDFRIYYTGDSITNTIEITKEKIVEVPKIEYIYIENEKIQNDSSEIKECKENIITETVFETKTEIVEKEVNKIPKKIYIIITILILLILLLIIKLCRKYVE